MSTAARDWPLAVVFDCDGLLLDTAAAWRTAFQAALSGEGRVLDDRQLRELQGASVRGAAKTLAVPSGALRSHLEDALRQELPAPLPGALTLLEALRPNARLAVATNGPAGVVTSALRDAGLLEYFAAIVTAEDQPREKPAPDVYLAACQALRVDPSDAIALEDSPIGAASARRAGLVVVYVPSEPLPTADADLRVGRLDDPALLSLLGLGAEEDAHPDGRVRYRRELTRLCTDILNDEAVSRAGAEELHALVGQLQRSLIFWRRGLPDPGVNASYVT